MKQCPKCKKWTLDFDDYFGRFRCFNARCGWMAPSSAEREIRLLEGHQEPKVLFSTQIEGTGLTLRGAHDVKNDALVFDFARREATFDLPEPDGRLIWRISERTGCVTGFTFVGVKELGVSDVNMNVGARKVCIERKLSNMPSAVVSRRATKTLIENLEGEIQVQEGEAACLSSAEVAIADAFQREIQQFQGA